MVFSSYCDARAWHLHGFPNFDLLIIFVTVAVQTSTTRFKLSIFPYTGTVAVCSLHTRRHFANDSSLNGGSGKYWLELWRGLVASEPICIWFLRYEQNIYLIVEMTMERSRRSQSVFGLYLSSELKYRSHDKKPSPRRGLKWIWTRRQSPPSSIYRLETGYIRLSKMSDSHSEVYLPMHGQWRAHVFE